MKLTKREVILVTILLIVGLLYGTYTFIAKPLQSRYLQYQDEKAAVEMREMEQTLKLAKKPELEKTVQELKSNIEELSDVVIDPLVPELIGNYLLDQLADSELFANSISLGQITDLSGAAIVSTVNGDTEKAGDAQLPEGAIGKTMTVDLALSGRYSQIYSFLARLEDENRAVEIISTSLSKIDSQEQVIDDPGIEDPEIAADTMLSASVALNYYQVQLPEGYQNADDPYTKPAFRMPEGKDQPFG